MELTKEERLKVYKLTLRNYLLHRNAVRRSRHRTSTQGLCGFIILAHNELLSYKNKLIRHSKEGQDNLLKLYPEFLAKKPKNARTYDYWWVTSASYNTREKVMNAIISKLS